MISVRQAQRPAITPVVRPPTPDETYPYTNFDEVQQVIDRLTEKGYFALMDVRPARPGRTDTYGVTVRLTAAQIDQLTG